MRVAIVHDWLTTFAGAERVLEQMLKLYPQAEIFTLVDFLPVKDRGFLEKHRIHTSFIQNLPKASSGYRNYLPLMPLAIEQFDLSSFDLVFSSSHAMAKGVLTGPDQLHVCMCYSPIRYAWDLQHQYLNELGLTKGLKSAAVRALLHYIRLWDTRTSNGVDLFISISDFITRRIRKVYRREAVVVYPPVDFQGFTLEIDKEDFYFTASRMVPYKKIDLIVGAFSAMPERRLKVIGDGPEMSKILSKAGTNVELLGYQPFEVLRDHMQRARAFVFAAEEDFGIAPVEAQACGTPVIAYKKGGALETVKDGQTGLFFERQTTESIQRTVQSFEAAPFFEPQACRDWAEHFEPGRMRSRLETILNTSHRAFAQGFNVEQAVLEVLGGTKP